MATLHGYVLRELLKTFGLTLAALTVLFTLGGGLFNIVRHEGVSANDIMAFIPMLIPIVVTLTMPVAALFAATMVYGRLAADNELLACRAAGVNVHRLFLSAILLSVFVASFTLLFGDLVIPDFIARLNQYARTNLRDLALRRLQTQGHVHYENAAGDHYLLTALGAAVPSSAALREQDLPVAEGLSYLFVDNPVILIVDRDDTLSRYATARYGLCQFDTRGDEIKATLFVDEGRDFDLRGRSAWVQRQQIGPIPFRLPFKRRASMVDLATLVQWRQQPWEIDNVKAELRPVWRDMAAYLFIAYTVDQLNAGQTLTFADEYGQPYEISGAAAEPGERGTIIRTARVELPQQTGPPKFYTAPRATLRPRPALRAGPIQLGDAVDRPQMLAQLELAPAGDGSVREHNPQAPDYRRGRERPQMVLSEDLRLPADLREQMAALSPPRVIDPAVAFPLPPELDKRRAKLVDFAALQQRKMRAVIHYRLGFTSSTLVTIVMAAALGVIFRGSRALAAFGLGCIPFAAVALLMVMARQLGEKEGTEMLGPLLTWGGLGLVALADMIILRVGVRR